ncbi:MAG: MBL fold metallo-hydrolase [Bdellovibrionaceae bacterium]|nr:MBL fold metallo-hydrolase [Pseudobdellovibrionaceae bacterium]
MLFSGCTGPRYRGPVSDHFNGKKFFSPYGLEPKGFMALLRWQWEGGSVQWPLSVENSAQPQISKDVAADSVAVTFVSHATVLLQFQGINILTDPMWSDRASPFSSFGPKRVRAPGVDFSVLPKIDLVLISHNHYDHLDLPTIRRLVEKHDPLFLVALGDGRLIEDNPGIRFKEMDWGQTHSWSESMNIHFLPAQHWSARGFFDRNLSLWGSFMVEPSKGPVVYFAGDTGYAPHFKDIAARFPRIDLALLPIGAYEPRWFMKDQHMNPADAVDAHRDLKARRSMGIHFGTWHLTNEGIDEPVTELAKARAAAGLAETDFVTLDAGETSVFRHER